MDPLRLTERRMRVDQAAIRRYADVTRDYNPIHLDAEFAAKSAMGGIVAHGMLSLSLLWQAVQDTFGLERMAGATMDVRFARPVRVDDWVVAGGERVDGGEAYRVWVRAEGRSETVISGTFIAGKHDNTTGGTAP